MRIAVLTSGGDAPGMNAAIRAATRAAVQGGADVYGVRRGFQGLMEGDFTPLTARDVSGIVELGGTVLESSRAPAMKTAEGRAKALAALDANGISGLVVIGGSGTQCGSLCLANEGLAVNGVASTIDNDLFGTETCIGVDTAVNVALEAIDRLRTTASSHRRCSIVEVMGRDCGYLALASGLAGGAEVIVTPEMELRPEEVYERLCDARRRGKKHAMVVVAEGAKNHARHLFDALAGDDFPEMEPRLTVLGHIQRGARPWAFDRLLGTRLAARAVELLIEGRSGLLVGLMESRVCAIPLAEAAGRPKPLPEELLRLAGVMGL